jgi:Protease inhibitor Inh
MIALRPALAATLCTALLLAGCTSARLGGYGPGPAAAGQPLPQPDPVEAVPSGPVTSAPLPPLDGGPGPVVAPGSTDIAALPPGPSPAPVPPPIPAPSGRSAVVGGWTARTAGTSCRIQLSSTPALDLYRASASGCSSGDLARVSAWDYRDGEVFLYQSGGTVAARLRSADGGLSGVLTKSGAPLSLAR